ncbi:MAG TPA: Hpt domain-containing protein [Planctomycetaceae bacterium]
MSAARPPGGDRPFAAETPSASAAGRGPAAAFDLDEALAELPGDLDMLYELAALFLDECPRVLRQTREALDRGDLPAARRGAHTLKSSAGIFAAHDMADAAYRFERAAADGDAAALPGALAELEREAVRVTDGLKRLCAGG